MVSKVKERVLESVAKGERELESAKEILKIGKRAGIDLAAEETELIAQESRLRELKEATEDSTEEAD